MCLHIHSNKHMIGFETYIVNHFIIYIEIIFSVYVTFFLFYILSSLRSQIMVEYETEMKHFWKTNLPSKGI